MNTEILTDPAAAGELSQEVLTLASQSGLSLDVLGALKERLIKGKDALPTSISQWVRWTLKWLYNDEDARDALFGDIWEDVLSSCGEKTDSEDDKRVFRTLDAGIQAWISGKPLNAIEVKLNGTPDSDTKTKRLCPHARTLASTIIPRGFTFALSVVIRMLEELQLKNWDDEEYVRMARAVPAAVRRGFNTVELLEFAYKNGQILSRVLTHHAYAEKANEL